MTLNRDELIEDLADRLVDSVDMKTLISYFVDSQVDWLNSLGNRDLIDYAINSGGFSEEEIEENYGALDEI